MEPFGALILKGLCTGQEVLGPHRVEGPGNGTELKLFVLHGLHNDGNGSGGPCIEPKLTDPKSWPGTGPIGPPI